MDDAPDTGGFRLFLFPLGLVLLPGELLPLHIFEDRYKRLIAHCRETGEPFGIVWHDGDALAIAGCTAKLVTVLEEFPDGRSNIVVIGHDRFTLSELHPPDDPDTEALAATVDRFDDREATPPAEAIEEVQVLFEQAVELLDSEEPADRRKGVAYSFWVAAALELEPALKQRLLELRDEGDRLRLVAKHLRPLIARLEVIRSREDAIRGNGKGY